MIILATDITTSMGHEVDMTRDRAYMLNSQVNSFLSSCPLYLDNGNVRTLVLLMNDGEDKKGREFAWTGFGHNFIYSRTGTKLFTPFLEEWRWSGWSYSFHFRPSQQQQWRRSQPSHPSHFGPFCTAETEEERTELFDPFRTIHGAETLIDYNSTLRRWFKGHEDSLESS